MNELEYLKQEVRRLTEENIELVRANYEFMEIIQMKNALIEKLDESNQRNIMSLIDLEAERDNLIKRKKRA